MGQVILLALATPVAVLIAFWVTGTHPLAFVMLLYLSPLIFIASLFFFGWLLVGPYRPNAHLTVSPPVRPPMPSRSAAPLADAGAGPQVTAQQSRAPAAQRTPTVKPIASRR